VQLHLYPLLGKLTVINSNYKLWNKLAACSQSVEDLGTLLDCKLHFHSHVDYIFSQSLKMLRLIHYITLSFSTTVCLYNIVQSCQLNSVTLYMYEFLAVRNSYIYKTHNRMQGIKIIHYID
jgi:hypothetical protein